MKPFTFRCRKTRRLLCPTQKREVRGSYGHPAFTSSSNVQLCPAENESHDPRTSGPLAAGGLAVNRGLGRNPPGGGPFTDGDRSPCAQGQLAAHRARTAADRA